MRNGLIFVVKVDVNVNDGLFVSHFWRSNCFPTKRIAREKTFRYEQELYCDVESLIKRYKIKAMHSCATVYNSHLSHLNQSSLYLAREKQNKLLDKQKQESSQKLYEQMRFILRYSHNFQVVCRQTRWIRTIANAGCKSVLSDSTYRDLPWSLPNPHGLHRNFDFKSSLTRTAFHNYCAYQRHGTCLQWI